MAQIPKRQNSVQPRCREYLNFEVLLAERWLLSGLIAATCRYWLQSQTPVCRPHGLSLVMLGML